MATLTTRAKAAVATLTVATAGAAALLAGSPVGPSSDQCTQYLFDSPDQKVQSWTWTEGANMVMLRPKVPTNGTQWQIFTGAQQERSVRLKPVYIADPTPKDGVDNSRWVSPFIGRVVECFAVKDNSPTVTLPPLVQWSPQWATTTRPPDPCNTPGGVGCPP